MASRLVVLSGEAQEDLQDIFSTSLQRWSFVQTQRYMDGFDKVFADLASGDRPADLMPLGSAGLRRILVSSHAVFIREENGVVNVVRVIHQAQRLP